VSEKNSCNNVYNLKDCYKASVHISTYKDNVLIFIYYYSSLVPKIILEGIGGYAVYLDPSSKSGKFVALYYSLYEVSEYSFEIGNARSDALVKLAKKSIWDISNRLEIEFTEVNEFIYGSYVLTVSNDNNKEISQRISVREKKGNTNFKSDPHCISIV